MNKKQTLASLMIAVTVLGVTPVSTLAEETNITSPVDVVVPAPKEDTKPVVPVTPTEPTQPKEETTPAPVVPENPVTPVVPDETKPVQPETPLPKEEKPTQPETPKEEVKPEENPKGEEKKEEPIAPPVTEEIKKAEENTGVKTTDIPKEITVTQEEIAEQPIVTNTGHTVVGTNEGNVLVATSEGVEEKPAESIGAVKQKDGTVALKDDKGELKVLPSTGTAENIIMSLFGFALLAGVVLMKKVKLIKNNKIEL